MKLFLTSQQEGDFKNFYLSKKVDETKDFYQFSGKDIKKSSNINFFSDIFVLTDLFLGPIEAIKLLFKLDYSKLNKFDELFKEHLLFSNDKLDEEYIEELSLITFKDKPIGYYLNSSFVDSRHNFYFINKTILKEMIIIFFDTIKTDNNHLVLDGNLDFFVNQLDLNLVNYFNEPILFKSIREFQGEEL